MAQRYLGASDFPGEGAAQNRLYINGTAVNGRISESDEGPTVVVDGREYSWEEFGKFLSPFTGFNFRLECFDASAEPETTPDPPRPYAPASSLLPSAAIPRRTPRAGGGR